VVVEEQRKAVDLASENELLRSDLANAREEIVAANEVLAAMGRSASDLELVLDTIVEGARRLSRADGAVLYVRSGPVFRIARSLGTRRGFVEHMKDHPILLDRDSLTGRIALDRQAVQIPDVLADPDYRLQDAQRVGGYRTVMGAPMLLDGDVIGVLQVQRTHVREFDQRAHASLTSFAAAAAIAVRNLDLVRTLEARSDELSSKVEQLEALRAIGDAVSSSLDLDETLSTIIRHAVELSGTDGGSLMEFDDQQRLFFVRTAYRTSSAVLERLKTARITLEGTLVGRAAMEACPLQVADMTELVDLDVHQQVLHDAGWRSMLAVPILRDDDIIGVLVVRRRQPGGVAPEICELLETFASQSALAILNARLFRELERKSAELEVASRHKSEFLASMSHELRTPLNAVIGFSEVLLDRMFGDINDRQEEYLRDIWNSGKHLLQLLSEILDLSKVEAGRMELDVDNFSVDEAINYAVSMVRERADRRALRLIVDVDDGLGVIQADELRFKQIVLNLLSNAVKFTPEGGVVTVAATSRDGDVIVTVTDTGVGVAPADRERIFESFQQGRRGASTQEGTGLGLTLCRRIVGLMGGQMWLDSEVGVGSTFGFTVPGRSSPAVQPASPADTDGGERSPTVLVIDDDRRSTELLTAHLGTAGFGVEVAHDGKDGLERTRQREPAAIVLDIVLPGLDGWEVLRCLKSDPTTRHIPVIIVSILDERARGLALGAVDHLVKPVSRDDLLLTLANAGVSADVGARSADRTREA
jgi:signal transduction histidine kinase/ActR/RegA family two-component response regulator